MLLPLLSWLTLIAEEGRQASPVDRLTCGRRIWMTITDGLRSEMQERSGNRQCPTSCAIPSMAHVVHRPFFQVFVLLLAEEGDKDPAKIGPASCLPRKRSTILTNILTRSSEPYRVSLGHQEQRVAVTVECRSDSGGFPPALSHCMTKVEWRETTQACNCRSWAFTGRFCLCPAPAESDDVPALRRRDRLALN